MLVSSSSSTNVASAAAADATLVNTRATCWWPHTTKANTSVVRVHCCHNSWLLSCTGCVVALVLLTSLHSSPPCPYAALSGPHWREKIINVHTALHCLASHTTQLSGNMLPSLRNCARHSYLTVTNNKENNGKHTAPNTAHTVKMVPIPD